MEADRREILKKAVGITAAATSRGDKIACSVEKLGELRFSLT